MSSISNYLIINDKLINTESSGKIHDRAKNVIGDAIIDRIKSVSRENSKNINVLLDIVFYWDNNAEIFPKQN